MEGREHLTSVVKKLQEEICHLEERIEDQLDKSMLPTKLLAELQDKRKALEFSLNLAG